MSDRSAPAMPRAEAERLLGGCEIHSAFGLELVAWCHGAVTFRFVPPALARTGERSSVHGGALVTALDTAACFAVIAAVGVDCFTVDLRADFMRPAVADEFLVHGEALRAGRRFATGQARIVVDEDRPLAAARGTFTW